MIIDEITFELKDGRTALIRSPRVEDADTMLDYLRTTAGETHFLMRYPEEFADFTAEGEKEFIDRINADPREIMPVCFVDGVLAGNASLMYDFHIKTRHRASIGIALKTEFWGLGIGTKLFEVIISHAEKLPGLMQLELEVIEGNERGMRLYEKFGFETVAVHPDAIKLKDGTLLSTYLMLKRLH